MSFEPDARVDVMSAPGEPVLAGDKTCQVANQRPVRNQGAFGRTSRSAGVNQHSRIVGKRLFN